MRNFSFLAVLIASSISTQAIAITDDWALVPAGSSSRTYVERSSIREAPNGFKRAWFKTAYDDDSQYIEQKSYFEYDCTERRSRYLSIVTYLKNGENFTTDKLGNWRYITPDTTGELVFEYVCFGVTAFPTTSEEWRKLLEKY